MSLLMGLRGQSRIRTPNEKEEQLGRGGFVCAVFGPSAPRTQCLRPRGFVHKIRCVTSISVSDEIASGRWRRKLPLVCLGCRVGRVDCGHVFLGPFIRETWDFLPSFIVMWA